MKKNLKYFVLLIILFLIPFVYNGCGGNPAAAPSFPAEIPAVLKFVSYDGLKISADTISPSAGVSVNKSTLPLTSDATDYIQVGPILFKSFDEIFYLTINNIQSKLLDVINQYDRQKMFHSTKEDYFHRFPIETYLRQLQTLLNS